MTFPQLIAAAEALAKNFDPRYILIEGASSGTGLAQTIKGKYASAVRRIKPEHNKETRLFLQQAKFERGEVFFPKDAPWLRVFLDELLSFPESMYADQIDSVSQALAFQAPAKYTRESNQGLASFTNSLMMSQRFG